MTTENKSVDKMQPVRWLSPATPQRPSIDRKLVVDFRGEENDADDNGNATIKRAAGCITTIKWKNWKMESGGTDTT